MRELDNSRRLGAQTTFFRLGEDPGLARFIESMAKRVEGRMVSPELDDLGAAVVGSYLGDRAASTYREHFGAARATADSGSADGRRGVRVAGAARRLDPDHHHGKPATTLGGGPRVRGRRRVDDPQELMARLTGNYKRGNERMGKNHPRNRGR